MIWPKAKTKFDKIIPTIKLEGSYAKNNNNNNFKVVHASIARSLPPTASTSTSRNMIVPPSTASQESTSTAPRCSQIIWGRGGSFWGQGGSLKGRGNLRRSGGQVFRGRGGHNILGPPPPPSIPSESDIGIQRRYNITRTESKRNERQQPLDAAKFRDPPKKIHH